ncbi:sensor domain-containing diguanylate cyclase [Devosia sp. WQ 349]|uniref:sensor domain-containing diguanylate cyclase n=1 Tax=Devosia sp. WQ 349K1 TaxID=2800329 RepID=UPI0019046AC9|nr:sensor domain-containing diguanylate cyclase [Devosia sp. WQ 349K1]MBK1794218.1 sensor domain-containing diguanylate cyclase [Devosia sp. WQ 349K1]
MSSPTQCWQDVSGDNSRLAALQALDILDSPREPAFDRISDLIRLVFDVDIGLVTLIDAHRQWYKASVGMTNTEQDLDSAFCRFTLEAGDTVIVNDATEDARFADHEKVVGAPYIRFYAGTPIFTSKGLMVGTICAVDTKKRTFGPREMEILRHLAAVVMQGLELRQEAITDVLTGASSRRSFKEEAKKHISLSNRNNSPLSCISLDIDHFKQINDTYGHAAGDQVLTGVVKAFKETLRQSDIVGRLGGEEFAVLLPQTEEATAMDVAEKLRQVVKKLRFPHSRPPISVTSSFGVASLVPGDDIEALIARSDAALYTAKRTGRDRVHLAPKPDEAAKLNRRRVLKAGQIIFNDGRSTYDCTIRSLWDDGAEATLALTTVLPDHFDLRIKGSTEQYHCKLLKRSVGAVEMVYLDTPKG